MDWLNNGFGLLATIFGVVSLAGGAAGYFKASRGDSIIKYQATEIGLRDAKVANLEKDLAKVTESCVSKDATIKQLEEHNKYLQKLGQGSPELKKMNATLTNNTRTVDSLVKVVEKLIKQEKK